MLKQIMAAALLASLPAGDAIGQAAASAEWPSAGPAVALSADSLITRIAVGSCNRHDQSQDYWPVIAAKDPQLFLMIGDNVYGDIGWDGGADLGTFRAAYAGLAGSAGFAALRARVPMLTTWDDHDFGPNDGGGSFVFKETSERLYEHFWHSSPEVRSRSGVFESTISGPVGQRLQVIMLDTRFFRSDLAEVPLEQRAGRLGRLTPLADPAATMLGDAQWRWLEAELAKPADMRIVVSSIQVITSAHFFESWSQLPLERERLLRLLAGRADSGLVLLSGDRHAAAIYSAALPDGEEVWELTTSSLNVPLFNFDMNAREPDPLRRTRMFADANFGMIEIDWAARQAALAVEGTSGVQLTRQVVDF